jgi:hypothetical protein
MKMEKYFISKFIICTLHKILRDYVKDEMGWEYNTYMGDKKCINNFSRET